MKKRVLIVDDDAGIQDILKIIFDRAGYQTTIYASGSLILEDKFDNPDIFIVDKQLSGVDGLDICRHLKRGEHTRNIPIIMVSASPDIDKLSHAAGADAFVEKPFRSRDLLDCVAKHINSSVAV
jgi:DNA-binding response OmpR family regulator